MDNIRFWNEWPKSQRNFYIFLLALLTLSIAIYLIAYFQGLDGLVDWKTTLQISKAPVLVDNFQLALFNLELFADQFLLQEIFSAGEIKLNIFYNYSFLIFLAIGISVLIAVFTTFSRFWYIAGMAFMIYLAISLQTEHLLLFGKGDTTSLLIIFALYLPLSYYFHAFDQNKSLLFRIVAFLLVSLLFGIFIGLFARVSNPWLYLSNYGIAGPVVIAIIFILIVAHEVITGFLFIITNGSTIYSKNNIFHFSFLSIIYLGFLLITYLRNTTVITWDFYYIDAFLLLILSGVAGIWGYRKKRQQLEGVISFGPIGEYFYVAMGIICFITIAFFHATANDPMLEAFEDIIIFSHLGFGIIFFIYVILNFSTPLQQNAEVHKIVYKPMRMPYFQVNIVGIVIVGILLFKSNLFTYRQAVAGYYNGLGDIYHLENNYFLAEQYYKIGHQNAFNNHRSNYSLATLASKQNDPATALYYFQQAKGKKPSEYGYIRLSNIYNENNRIFDAVFTLKEALAIFPKEGPIYNNIGLLYSRLNMKDSADYFFRQASFDDLSVDEALTNQLFIYHRHATFTGIDSTSYELLKNQHLPLNANLLSLANKYKLKTSTDLIPKVKEDSVLTPEAFSYVYNYALYHIKSANGEIAQILKTFTNIPENGDYHEVLNLLLALNLYYNSDVAASFDVLERLSYESSAAGGYYLNILGLLSIDQGAYAKASAYFSESASRGYDDALVNQALALSAAGDHAAAINLWETVVGETNPQLADEALAILGNSPLETERQRYQRLFFNMNVDQGVSISNIARVKDPLLQADLLEKSFQRTLREGKLDSARHMLTRLSYLAENTPSLEDMIAWGELQLLAENRNYEGLQQKLEEVKPISTSQKLQYMLFEALVAQHKGNDKRAIDLFDTLIRKNPFYEQAYLQAASFYNKKQDNLKAYELLLNALGTNTHSVVLHKAFILESLQLGLEDYAGTSLLNLKELTDSADYADFLQFYNQQLGATQARENWQ